MRSILVENYQIHIGDDSLSQINFLDYSRIAILVDENTKKDCLPVFLSHNKIHDNFVIIEIPSGEANKNIFSCNIIWKKLIDNKFDRDSLLINLGGGVIGDMGGYCASVYKRGISFIHVPTTLLAMCDASIGGKLGINFNGLKNQIGLFNNPKMVLISTLFLDTLERNQLNSGYAEIIKHVLIEDKEKWVCLKSSSLENINWQEKIFESVSIKNSIVVSDYKETGVRKKLNFGHTFAHAIESYYLLKEDPILHGEAVFMGMILESEMSNLSNQEKIDIKEYILSNFELPYFPPKTDLIKFLMNDKKNQSDKINFSLLNGIGDCLIDQLFTVDEL